MNIYIHSALGQNVKAVLVSSRLDLFNNFAQFPYFHYIPKLIYEIRNHYYFVKLCSKKQLPPTASI